MRQVFAGAVLLIAGIAAFIEASSHHPELESRCSTGSKVACPAQDFSEVHIGLSQTAYDLLRIGAWALVIVGVLIVITGLLAYWGAQSRRRQRPG